jgi:small GTP-binding protein
VLGKIGHIQHLLEGMTLQLKVTLVGDGVTGKTSVLVAYTKNQFLNYSDPTIFDEFTAEVEHNGRLVTLKLMDTSGREDESRMRAKLCYPDTDVFLLFYSYSSPTSLENIIPKWVPEVRSYYPQTPLVLVGQKCDFYDAPPEDERPVQLCDREKARKTAEEIGAFGWIEVSALQMKNIQELFQLAILAGLYSSRDERKRNGCVVQ